MSAIASETALATWECPICNAKNTEFLVEGNSLPDELQCSFCGHESGLIKWDSKMALKRFWDEHCPDCGKKQTGRTESNNRIWWTPCDCKQLPNCPIGYPRLVSKKSISPVEA